MTLETSKMFSPNRKKSMFEPKMVRIPPPAPIQIEQPPDVLYNKPQQSGPIHLRRAEARPMTRAEIKDENKRTYLPTERLSIKLNKQMEKEKMKKKSKTNTLTDAETAQIQSSLKRIIHGLQ